MKSTTLCYIEHEGSYLLLHRIKKENDLNEGKWIGVGGHVEPGETPEECIRREVLEETGLTLGEVDFRGVVDFISDRWEDEAMYLYTSSDFSGTLIDDKDCREGVLEWVPKDRIFELPTWEGDRVFLEYLLAGRAFFHLSLHYDASDRLISHELLPSVVLASASPRRLELLNQIGIRPIILPSNIEEVPVGNTPAEIVCSLSRQKAEATALMVKGEAAVLGADTVVTIDGKILGKPASHEEAAEMIRSLSGRTHEVYTGVTVIFTGEPSGRKNVSFAEKTEVRVAPMTEAEIRKYADSDEPMDKAGAYGIQGSFAAFIEGINGDYTNVVGLPVGSVYRVLR